MAGDDQYYPGVSVIEKPFTPTRQFTATATAFGAFIGKSNQGPTTPFQVGSWKEFTDRYGTTYTDLHAAVSDFFNNGGQNCYVQRIVGAASSTASVNIYADDAPADPQNPGQVLPGTPALFTITALNPGAWGNALRVQVSARDSANKRFDLAVFRVPTTVTFDPSKRNAEYLVEQWIDVCLDANDSRYLYDVVNPPSSTASVSVHITGQSYDPTTPSIRPYPSVIGAYSLTGGVDGNYASLSFDSDSAYEAGIDNMTQIPGPYILNIPNVTDSDVIRYAVTSASTRSDVFVVIDPPSGQTATGLQSYIQSTLALGTLGTSQPSYGAVYGPWLYMPSIGSNVVGRVSLRPPGGAIVGMMIANDTQFGVWKAPAGLTAIISGAVDAETHFIESDLRLLNNAHLNVIRTITGSGMAVMGARSLKLSGQDVYVSTRRMMIYLSAQLKLLTEYAVFQPNGPKLWQDLQAVCSKFLGGVWQLGGLKGSTAKEAFYVKCDIDNNPQSSTDNGYVNIETGVALLTPAEFIVITIGQFDGGSTSSTSI